MGYFPQFPWSAAHPSPDGRLLLKQAAGGQHTNQHHKRQNKTDRSNSSSFPAFFFSHNSPKLLIHNIIQIITGD
jgi:hypothetical protein